MIRAKRSLGQNFLHDEAVVNQIIEALDLTGEDTVLEIGPGLGALTVRLAAKAGEVIAVEFDRDMVVELRDSCASLGNLTIVNTDALNVDLADLLADRKSIKVAANLPYNISTAILQRFIEESERFKVLVLMFQKEVVDRLTAQPGNSERGYMTVLTENVFKVEKLFEVAPSAFRPVPKVTSAVARLTPRRAEVDRKELAKLSSLAFAQKRKTILNNLKSLSPGVREALEQAGIQTSRRAETLAIEEWALLSAEIKKSQATSRTA